MTDKQLADERKLIEKSVTEWAMQALDEGRMIVKLMPPNECHDGPRYAGYYCHNYTGPGANIF